ncbi:MAG: Holliday junction resolvase RecU [Oscillospiraceae bacterium]|jgi:recombination protein U|nr:Holliday junction resolvase RecU [Oscillospiraceae bacterium]
MKSWNQANRGQPFEEYLYFVHSRYQSTGTACVHKVPTEFIPLRDTSGKVCNVKVERKSCIDYLGRYKSTPVAVEAKHTDDKRIAFSRVEPHQADYMDDWCKDPDAVGIVLVSFQMRRFFAVPWPFWREARKVWLAGKQRGVSASVKAYGWFWDTPGMASVSTEQLLPDWEIRAGGTTGLPYLNIIDQMKRA